MLRIGIITGSTRPNRVNLDVSKWVYEQASKRSDAEFELVDIMDYNLPLLDESIPPAMGQYSQPHTKKWAAKIGSLDAFIFVHPEYNHGISGALKNALDFLYKEWNNKVAGMVSYGSAGGARAAEQMRLVLAELQIATVRSQVMFSLKTDFEDYKNFKPASSHEKELTKLIDQVINWGTAFTSLHEEDREERAMRIKPEKSGQDEVRVQ